MLDNTHEANRIFSPAVPNKNIGEDTSTGVTTMAPMELLGLDPHAGLQNANSDTPQVLKTPMKPELNFCDQMSIDIGIVSLSATLTIPQLYNIVNPRILQFFIFSSVAS